MEDHFRKTMDYHGVDINALKMICEFYDGDWAGVILAKLDLSICRSLTAFLTMFAAELSLFIIFCSNYYYCVRIFSNANRRSVLSGMVESNCKAADIRASAVWGDVALNVRIAFSCASSPMWT